MSDKSGAWFFELILNVLLLAGVAWVTFASRGEQERGLAVPLFAAVATIQGGSSSTGSTTLPPNALTPAAPALTPTTTPTTSTSVVTPVVKPAPVPAVTGNLSYQQAFGALEVWAAGLDGKISADELKKIQDSLQTGWNSTQSVRDYLKSVNDRINAGQTDAVINEALKTLSQQVNEKKVLVMNAVLQMMRDNGITWDQAKVVLTKWITEVLKLSPMDVVNALKP
ncbi:MAG: hypothetical protein WCG80_04495 [Spirochaetales bacterium]